MDMTQQTEEQFIRDIKDSIQDSSLNVSNKVIQSAYAYLLKHQCIVPGKEDVAKNFFVKKIPVVLANELTKELNQVLGLNTEN